MTYRSNKRHKVKAILKKSETDLPIERGEIKAVSRYIFKEKEARDGEGTETLSSVGHEAD